eukprot:6189455-Pleurochrysis_carterae.AAC.2
MKHRQHSARVVTQAGCAHEAFAVEVAISRQMRGGRENVNVVDGVHVEDQPNHVQSHGFLEFLVGFFGVAHEAARINGMHEKFATQLYMYENRCMVLALACLN